VIEQVTQKLFDRKTSPVSGETSELASQLEWHHSWNRWRTRSQAVAKIADRTALQQIISDCC